MRPLPRATTPAGRRLLKYISESVHQCIRDFRLFTHDDPVVLGLSGGKDSTLAAMILAQLGYRVHPAIVDLGYEHFDAPGIAAAAREWGFTPVILQPTIEAPLVKLLPHSQKKQLQDNLSFLADPGDRTPCGHCSQSKRLLLKQYAESIHSPAVVLAHHRTDFAATILKDYFLNRYLERKSTYSREAFSQFISQDTIDADELQALVAAKLAAGMAIRTRLAQDVDVVRPLAYVGEAEISFLVHEELGLTTFGSGCSHSIFLQGNDDRATKRELVHAELRRRNGSAPSLESMLFQYARSTLDRQGRLRFNPRANRGDLPEASNEGSP